MDDYNHSLYSTCDPGEITRLSNIVFIEGHLDRIDDLLIAILPLANIIYYQYIRPLDDREYAKEDLISDAILRLYQDIKLRWDKYIHIDTYYNYFSSLLRNGMIGLVHDYHNYYAVDELDAEGLTIEDPKENAFDIIELKLLKSTMHNNIVSMTERLLKCRKMNTNLLLNIFRCRYIDNVGLESLRSRIRVLGISTTLFNFYCEHVDYIYKLSYYYQYASLGGKQKMIERLSSTIDRFEDVTYKMLSINYYDSIIPEIYAEFGADIAKKFVRTFSGRTVQVPDYKEFCDNLLGGVVLVLAEGNKTNLYSIADAYNMPYKTLARIYNKAVKYDI